MFTENVLCEQYPSLALKSLVWLRVSRQLTRNAENR